MKSTGLQKFENSTVENFTSEIGLNIRKNNIINNIWRLLLRKFTNRKVILEQYPELNKDEAYVFVCNHSFDEDVISILGQIDRNVYVLNGSTDQTEHNPVFYALFVNGMIYVNRQNTQSRNSAVDKMGRVVDNGNSMMLFGEGGYNNSENRLINPLFHSPYILSNLHNVKVVPLIAHNPFGSDSIYIRAGEPMDLSGYDKYEASEILRDKMATILYDLISEHTEIVKRKDLYDVMVEEIIKEYKKKKKDFDPNGLPNDVRDLWMEMRKMVYDCQSWYNHVWDEELTVYSGHGVTTPEDAIKFVDNINITPQNAAIFSDMLIKREDDKHYDLKEYLTKTMILKK